MKLIEQLIAQGNAAEAAANELADNEEASLKRQQAYKGLEAEFASMCSDGSLDGAEVAKLFKDFKAQGLDTKTLEALQKQLRNGDATSRIKVTPEIREGLEEQLKMAELSNNDPMDAFKTQVIMAKHNQAWDLASRVSKAENEIYMAAIKHLVA